jgi:transcriptional regulator with XRE-family HTH domain
MSNTDVASVKVKIKIIGERIKLLRNSQKLTQEEFAKIIGRTRPTVAAYEAFDRYPDIETLIEVSNYFNCSLDYLTGRSEFINADIEYYHKSLSEKYGVILKDSDDNASREIKNYWNSNMAKIMNDKIEPLNRIIAKYLIKYMGLLHSPEDMFIIIDNLKCLLDYFLENFDINNFIYAIDSRRIQFELFYDDCNVVEDKFTDYLKRIDLITTLLYGLNNDCEKRKDALINSINAFYNNFKESLLENLSSISSFHQIYTQLNEEDEFRKLSNDPKYKSIKKI